MKKYIISIYCMILCQIIAGQSTLDQKSKISMVNGSSVIGQVVEYKKNEFVKIKITDNQTIKIKTEDIETISGLNLMNENSIISLSDSLIVRDKKLRWHFGVDWAVSDKKDYYNRDNGLQLWAGASYPICQYFTPILKAGFNFQEYSDYNNYYNSPSFKFFDLTGGFYGEIKSHSPKVLYGADIGYSFTNDKEKNQVGEVIEKISGGWYASPYIGLGFSINNTQLILKSGLKIINAEIDANRQADYEFNKNIYYPPITNFHREIVFRRIFFGLEFNF